MTNFLKTIFLSPEEPRLRAGWRILVQLLVLIFVSLLIAPIYLLMQTLPPAYMDLQLLVANGVPIIISILLVRRLIDRRSIRSLGLKKEWAWRDILVGIGIAALQMAFIFFLHWALGWMKVTGVAWQQAPLSHVVRAVLVRLVIYIGVGFYEELFSRGYQLQNLEDGTNTFWALLISSSVFAILHILNPNADWISTLGIFLAGFYLAYAYLSARSLWLAIGVHIGWNFFQGTVFGFPVSGTTNASLLTLKVDGPTLFTGGAFGPEAGLIVIPAFLLGVLLIWLYTRGRKPETNTLTEETSLG